MFFKKILKKQYTRLITKYAHASRAARILPIMVGRTFYVHNGHRTKRISVVRSYVGFKFGEFFFTRRLIKHKKKKKKNK